jgi:threonylcarbamoyladenosine tRNA methylthiotransferase MtaB
MACVNSDGKIKIAFHTLGCKLNYAETSTLSRLFPEERFEKVNPSKEADIFVVNTCSVTDGAERKCRQLIRKIINRSPGALIVVAGCYAQLRPHELSAIPGIDLVLGMNEKFDIGKYLSGCTKKETAEIHSRVISSSDPFIPSWSGGDRTRSFLKVQDGCDYGCSYCTVPLARGSSRNPPVKLLKEKAGMLASAGIREIVLTGVNTGDFGKSTGETLTDLLRELLTVQGIERYRLSSIEPNLLTDDIIEMTAGSDKIAPHFHVPVQSGCNKILGLMKRRYMKEVFAERVYRIKELIPLAGIGADVIAGFPGESPDNFEETFSFLENLPLSYLHVFTFSGRPGTIAEKLPGKVSPEEMAERSRKLLSLSGLKSASFLKLNSGKNATVLFEKKRTGNSVTGYTGNYIRVEHPWGKGLPGQIRNVRLKDISDGNRMTIELL